MRLITRRKHNVKKLKPKPVSQRARADIVQSRHTPRVGPYLLWLRGKTGTCPSVCGKLEANPRGFHLGRSRHRCHTWAASSPTSTLVLLPVGGLGQLLTSRFQTSLLVRKFAFKLVRTRQKGSVPCGSHAPFANPPVNSEGSAQP